MIYLMKRFLALIPVSFLVASCTVLQWRQNDEKVQDTFKEVGLETSLHYYTSDSLKAKIRIQKVPSLNNNSSINVVFLHGSPSSSYAWNGYLKDTTLLKKATIYAIDRPGYGYSNFGKEIPEIEKQSYLINEAIKSRKLTNVVIIGASYGGAIAAQIGVMNEEVKSIIMISPAIDPKLEKDIWASKFTQWWLTRWLVPTAYRVAGDEKTIHAKELVKIEPLWKELQKPVYHIHGNADDLVPYENVVYTEKQFVHHKIITIPNKGHEISWKHPELIKPHLIEIINDVAR